jgi:hypothetical protein
MKQIRFVFKGVIYTNGDVQYQKRQFLRIWCTHSGADQDSSFMIYEAVYIGIQALTFWIVFLPTSPCNPISNIQLHKCLHFNVESNRVITSWNGLSILGRYKRVLL